MFLRGWDLELMGISTSRGRGANTKKNHGCKNAVFEWHPIIVLQTAQWCSKFSFTYENYCCAVPFIKKIPSYLAENF